MVVLRDRGFAVDELSEQQGHDFRVQPRAGDNVSVVGVFLFVLPSLPSLAFAFTFHVGLVLRSSFLFPLLSEDLHGIFNAMGRVVDVSSIRGTTGAR